MCFHENLFFNFVKSWTYLDLFTTTRKFNELTSVFHASVLLLISRFRHNIVKEAEDPRGGSRVIQIILTMFWRDSLSTAEQTHKKLTSICFLQFEIVNCPPLLVDASRKLNCVCLLIDNIDLEVIALAFYCSITSKRMVVLIH